MAEEGHWSRRAQARLLCLFLLIALALLSFVTKPSPRGAEAEGILKVSILDVGQGDAIFIESPAGTTMLIDAGPDGSAMRGLSRELGFFGRTIDAVLLTHEDRDHVGGMPAIFDWYDVRSFIRTENQGDSAEADRIDELAELEGATIHYARRGMTFDLGAGTTLEILFPVSDPSDMDTNTSSIVARLVYGDTEFMLTGDSPESIERYLIGMDRESVRSDVLKAGHHGSKTSTSPEFVDAVAPEYAVFSAGRDNRYGHPHEEVIATLEDAGVQILNTAEAGTITFISDGDIVSIE